MRARWLPCAAPLLVALSLVLLGAGKGEDRAWKGIEASVETGNAERTYQRARQFLEEYPESQYAVRAQYLGGIAAMDTQRWETARRMFEAYLQGGGRAGFRDVQHRIAFCLAREGRTEDAAAALRNVAAQDEDALRSASASRELVSLHLFRGDQRAAIAALGLLLERDQFEPETDLDVSRKAVEGLSDEELAALEYSLGDEASAGIVAYLILERSGALLDAPETEDARRAFASRYPDHPLLSAVPGGEGFAEAPADLNTRAIGLLVPLSGRYAAPGELVLRGAQLALASATERLGWPEVELIPIDSGGQAEQAVAGLQALVEEHRVMGVVGPIVSALAPEVAAAADELKVPLLMMVQTPGLANERDFAFNTWVTAEAQVDTLVEQAVGRMGFRKFAIAYPAKASGGRLASRFWARVEEAGGTITSVESYEPTATDYRETARRLKGSHYLTAPASEVDLILPFINDRQRPQLSDPQVELLPGTDFQAVFVPDSYKRASMLAPGFLFEEINLGGHLPEEDYPPVILMGGAALNHPGLVDRGGKYTEGTLLVDGFFLKSDQPSVQAFAQAYGDAYSGEVPSMLEAKAYDTTLLLCQILAQEPAATNRNELLRRLAITTPVHTVTGARGFAVNRETLHEMLTLTVKKGQIVQLWPPPVEPEAESGVATGEEPAKGAPAASADSPEAAKASSDEPASPPPETAPPSRGGS